MYLYFGLDNLGSRRVVWNADGTVKAKFNYSAWGECTRVGGSAADEWLASFTGKEYDATGLLYFNARYYDPTLGRFLTEDPSRQGHSWYSYCNSNPLTYTDPTGRKYESAASAELTGNKPASEQIGRQPTWGERARAGLHRAREKWDRFIEAWSKVNAKFAPAAEAFYIDDYGYVHAVKSGLVFRVGWQDPKKHNVGMGWRVSVDTGDSYVDQYGHLDPTTPCRKILMLMQET